MVLLLILPVWFLFLALMLGLLQFFGLRSKHLLLIPLILHGLFANFLIPTDLSFIDLIIRPFRLRFNFLL